MPSLNLARHIDQRLPLYLPATAAAITSVPISASNFFQTGFMISTHAWRSDGESVLTTPPASTIFFLLSALICAARAFALTVSSLNIFTKPPKNKKNLFFNLL